MANVNITVTLHKRWWFKPLLASFALASICMPRRLRDKVWHPAIHWIVKHSVYVKQTNPGEGASK